MYTHLVIHSSVSRHLGCFHVLIFVNSAAMNIGVHISFQIRVFSRYVPGESFQMMVFSGYMPRSRIAGSCCSVAESSPTLCDPMDCNTPASVAPAGDWNPVSLCPLLRPLTLSPFLNCRKTPGQAPFLHLSSYFGPTWAACSALPRDLNSLSNNFSYLLGECVES